MSGISEAQARFAPFIAMKHAASRCGISVIGNRVDGIGRSSNCDRSEFGCLPGYLY